jgi:DNA-binding response OmpR family regulator
MPPALPGVLIVDRAPTDRTAPSAEDLRAHLQRAGSRVELVVDSAIGLTRVAIGAIDLVLLRLGPADVSDLAFCRQLRAQEHGLHLPIVLLVSPRTADAQPDLLALADDYAVYSADVTGLLDRVELWLWIRRRLKAIYTQTTQVPEPLSLFQPRALQRRQAQDAAALAMAHTVSDQLRQPLTALLGWLELWQQGDFGEQPPAFWYAKFRAAADSLAARIDTLGRITRYEPLDIGGQVQVSTPRARRIPKGPGAAGVSRRRRRQLEPELRAAPSTVPRAEPARVGLDYGLDHVESQAEALAARGAIAVPPRVRRE